MLLKGEVVCWILIASLAVILMASISIILSKSPEWCTAELKAGDCERNENDTFCYCINEESDNLTHEQTGVYEAAQRSCLNLNGSLATPAQQDILRWLAKRMYIMGVDNAVIGLENRHSIWYWERLNASSIAADLSWRFGINPQHKRATINVETIKVDSTNDSEIEYYYNYDYYIGNDPTYKWYGLKTYDNLYHYTVPVYHVCNYTKEPKIEPKLDETATGVPVEQNDGCYCSSNEQILLSDSLTNATFTSSNYPSNYCSDQSCRWFITAPEGLVVKLEWLVFKTEEDYDWVSIFDGHSMTDIHLLAKCSSNQCSNQISSGRHMEVHFNADHVTTDLGFKARVSAIEPDKCYCSKSASVIFSNLEDSSKISSPRYPQPYCINLHCSWTIHAPEGLGLHVEWESFDTEHSYDYLRIYDGLSHNFTLFRECTGRKCVNLTSKTHQLHIDFRSDPHQSEHAGFEGFITVVKNYCNENDLYKRLGTLTLSEQRADGFVPAGATATLHCPPNSTITTGLGVKLIVGDTVTCIGPHWQKILDICEPLCEPRCTNREANEDFHLCSFGLMYDGLSRSAIVNHYDYVTKKYSPIQTEHICSEGSVWVPELPLCYAGGILLIGGREAMIQNEPPQFEFYSPLNQSSVPIERDIMTIESHTAQVLPNGELIIMTGFQWNGGMFDWIKFSFTLNMDYTAITSKQFLQMFRIGPRSAILNGTVYICMGQEGSSKMFPVHDTCELLENGQWHLLKARLNEKRIEAAMVALGDSLYIMGGKGIADMELGAVNVESASIRLLSSVEKYSLSDPEWRLVSPMNKPRTKMAAATLNGFIYLCGGEFHLSSSAMCEQYSPTDDSWSIVAEMNVARADFYLLSFLGKLYALGGSERITDYGTIEYALMSIEAYNPTFDTWQMQEGKLIGGRSYAAAVVLPFMP